MVEYTPSEDSYEQLSNMRQSIVDTTIKTLSTTGKEAYDVEYRSDITYQTRQQIADVVGCSPDTVTATIAENGKAIYERAHKKYESLVDDMEFELETVLSFPNEYEPSNEGDESVESTTPTVTDQAESDSLKMSDGEVAVNKYGPGGVPREARSHQNARSISGKILVIMITAVIFVKVIKWLKN